MLAHNRRRILVVNPNSNEVVTRGLEAALAPGRLPGWTRNHL